MSHLLLFSNLKCDIAAWKSYEKYASISKGDKYSSFRFELDKLGLSLDDLSTQFLVFDNDPATVLDSPLPELRIIQVKPGHTLVELDSIVKTFYTEVKNDKYPELTFEDLPTLAWGPDKQNLGSSTYIVGWKGFEVCSTSQYSSNLLKPHHQSRELVLRTRRIVELLEMVQPIIHLEYKCLSLTRA